MSMVRSTRTRFRQFIFSPLAPEVGLSFLTRRDFLAASGKLTLIAGTTSWFSSSAFATGKASSSAWSSSFRVAVITDEISQDFEHACFVAAREFGMKWVEIRGLWNKNLMNLSTSEIAQAQTIVKRYGLRVTDIASPLFKVDWPGAPPSQYSPKHDQFNAGFGYEQQNEVLAKCIEVAKAFGTDRVRGFDFWRLEDQAPYRKAINAKLQRGSRSSGQTRP